MITPYYQAGGITIYHGDCRDVLPQLAAASVDLVFTSPPYNLGMSPGGGVENGRFYRPGISAKGKRFRDGYGEYDDALPWEDYIEWQKQTLRECWRIVDDDGAIFYNHKLRVMHKAIWTPLVLNPDLPLRQILIWDRGGGVGLGDGHFCIGHEWILVFAGDGFRLQSRVDSAIGDVWRIPYETDRGSHPAPFPIELPGRALLATGAATVLDPFMGSGTTLRAAKNLGRCAIGIEINERYCESAAKRLQQEVMELV